MLLLPGGREDRADTIAAHCNRSYTNIGLNSDEQGAGSNPTYFKEKIKMRKRSLLTKTFLPLLALCLVMSASMGTSPAARAQEKEKSLYERLGGYDAVAAVVDEFIKRLGEDKQLGRFLTGLSTDSKKKLRQHVLNQFCAATGGPCIYTGRDMKTVHTGLGITDAEWEIGAKHLADTLDKYKVPKKEKDEVIAFVSSLKKDIVGL